MSSEENKSLVRRYLEEVWGRGNYSAIRQYVSPDVVDHDPGPGQPCGLEGQEYAAKGFLGALSNYRLTVHNVLAEGDRVVDYWTFTATQTGPMANMPATGRKFTITGTDESRISGGKIVELWHREDILSMLQQLGFAPAPPLPQSFGTRPATGRTGTTASGPRLSDSDRRARIRQAFQTLIDRGDLGSAADFLTQDFAGHYSGFPPVYGIDGFREFISLYQNALSGRQTEIEEILLDGDYGFARLTYHGKNTGSMFGMPATGKSVAVKGLTIFRLAGDKVAEQWVNNDDLGLMQQLGAVPEMAGMEPAAPC